MTPKALIILKTALLLIALSLAACSSDEDPETEDPTPDITQEAMPLETHSAEEVSFIAENRSPDVPPLPFDDNPDPTECGIPQPWGTDNNRAYLTGYYDGELYQDPVLLYDSHSRLDVVAQAPHGTSVEIVLAQANPVLNYYMVRLPASDDPEGETQSGWIPAPFLSFDEPPDA